MIESTKIIWKASLILFVCYVSGFILSGAYVYVALLNKYPAWLINNGVFGVNIITLFIGLYTFLRVINKQYYPQYLKELLQHEETE